MGLWLENIIEKCYFYNCLIITVPYLEFFWAYRRMHRDWDFNKSIGERTDRQTDKSYGSI